MGFNSGFKGLKLVRFLFHPLYEILEAVEVSTTRIAKHWFILPGESKVEEMKGEGGGTSRIKNDFTLLDAFGILPLASINLQYALFGPAGRVRYISFHITLYILTDIRGAASWGAEGQTASCPVSAENTSLSCHFSASLHSTLLWRSEALNLATNK
jgi:hypothetical protein